MSDNVAYVDVLVCGKTCLPMHLCIFCCHGDNDSFSEEGLSTLLNYWARHNMPMCKQCTGYKEKLLHYRDKTFIYYELLKN